jgi:WD40 repeat protein
MSSVPGRLPLLAVLITAISAGSLPAADALPPGAVLRLGTPSLRQPYRKVPAVYIIATPDGKIFATRSDDRSVRLWDAAAGHLLHQLDDAEAVSAFAFAPDGRTLVTASGSALRLWDVATGRSLQQWQAHDQAVTSVAFTPDGQGLISGSGDRTVRQWDLTGKEIRKFGGKLDAIVGVAVSPDGKIVAAGARRSTVYLWDTATGQELKQLSGDGSLLFAIAFAPDGRSLAMCSKTIIRLWDVAEGKELRQFGQPVTDEVTSHNNDKTLAFSPSGALLAAGGKSIRVWDTATGKEVRSFGLGRRLVSSVAFIGEQVVASGGGEQEVHLWDVSTGTLQRPHTGHHDRVECVAFAPDGKTIVTGGADRALYLWDAATGKLLRPLIGHDSGLTAVAFSGDGKQLASADAGGTLRIWDPTEGKELHLFQAHQSGVTALAFSPDGKAIASAGRDGRLRLYDIAREREIHDFPKHMNGVTAVAFSVDGKMLASGAGDGQVRLWTMRLGEEVPVPEASPSDDDPAQMDDMFDGRPPPQKSPVQLLLFTPDGKRLTSWLESGAIVLWDAATRKPLRQFDGPAGGGAAFSHDGKTLAARDPNNQITLRETATGQERLLLPGHINRDFIAALAFAPDGRRLVSVCDDTTALIWDVTGRMRDGRFPPAKLTAKELDGIWSDLASEGGRRPYVGIWALVAAGPDAVPFLEEKLKPLAVEAAQIDKLIKDLDSNKFVVRQRAVAALEELSELAEAALKKALESNPPLEVRQRLDKLVTKIEKERNALNPHRLRVLRATEALEQIGTVEALRILEALAEAPPEMRLTDEVKHEVYACLARMERRIRP